MPKFPSQPGGVRSIVYDEASFGVGVERFTVRACGLFNLRNMLYDLRASLDQAIEAVEATIEAVGGRSGE